MNSAAPHIGNASVGRTGVAGFLWQTFQGDPRITMPDPGSRRFGSKGVRVAGQVFAMEWQGRLAVKISSDRVAAHEATGLGKPLTMGKRVMKEWLVVEDRSDWLSLAEEALNLCLAAALS